MNLLRRACACACAAALAALAGCASSPPPAAADAPPSTVAPGAVKIATVDRRYLRTAQFQRISEYLTNRENNAGRVVVRSQPDDRDGYYFILGLNWPSGSALPAGCVVRLDYIRMDDPVRRSHRFTLPATGTWPELFLGLTGADWSSSDFEILAYKLTLLDGHGTVIDERQSFLWSLPPPKAAPAPAVAAAATPPANAASAPPPAAN